MDIIIDSVLLFFAMDNDSTGDESIRSCIVTSLGLFKVSSESLVEFLDTGYHFKR